MTPYCAPPTVSQSAVQIFLSRESGLQYPMHHVARFADQAKLLERQLTDRGAMVLFVAASVTGITSKALEDIIAASAGVVQAVVRGLCDLGLVEVARDAAMANVVSLTDAGYSLVQAAFAAEE